jgi:hypothetical protein
MLCELSRRFNDDLTLNFARNLGVDTYARVADIINKMERSRERLSGAGRQRAGTKDHQETRHDQDVAPRGRRGPVYL